MPLALLHGGRVPQDAATLGISSFSVDACLSDVSKAMVLQTVRGWRSLAKHGLLLGQVIGRESQKDTETHKELIRSHSGTPGLKADKSPSA